MVYFNINTVLPHFSLAKSKSVWFPLFYSNQYAGEGEEARVRMKYELALTVK